MINRIIKTFYNIAKEHKLVRQFKYDRLSKASGIGEENHPLVFLEDPIYIQDSTLSQGSLTISLNFDVLLTPQAFENWNVKQLTAEECQSVAHSIALNFVAKINDIASHYDDYDEDEFDTSMRVVRYNFATLRNFYDNNAAGVRCSMVITVDNPIELCNLDEHFDPTKEFHIGGLLNPIDTDDAQGCIDTVWDYKLPKITI